MVGDRKLTAAQWRLLRWIEEKGPTTVFPLQTQIGTLQVLVDAEYVTVRVLSGRVRKYRISQRGRKALRAAAQEAGHG